MLVLNIDGDQRLIRGFEEARRRIGSAKPVLEDIGDVMLDEFDRNFDEGGRRIGKRWKKLKAATLRQKIRLGYGNKPILERTGKLRAGFGKDVTKFRVMVRNTVPYYRYHQLGERPQPQRKMAQFSDRLTQEIVAQFTKYIHEGLKGRR